MLDVERARPARRLVDMQVEARGRRGGRGGLGPRRGRGRGSGHVLADGRVQRTLRVPERELLVRVRRDRRSRDRGWVRGRRLAWGFGWAEGAIGAEADALRRLGPRRSRG